MASPAGSPRVRLRAPAEVAAALPFLLGFHPAESLVAIGVAGGQIRLTTRVDLPPDEDAGAVADLVAAHLKRARADDAVFAVVTEAPGAWAALPRRGLVDLMAQCCQQQRIGVRDALLVRAGRWWSYLCDAPRCCPAEGSRIRAEDAAELAAATAWLGEVVHGRREDLQRLLTPVGLFARAGLEQSHERVSAQFAVDMIARGRPTLAAESLRLLRAAVAARAEAAVTCSDAEVARLALGLADVAVRDEALCWAGGELDHAAESLWLELVRRATPPYDAAPATLLAAHAYLRGNGAAARVAAERALHSDPGYSFARLLERGLDLGVPPRALRAALRGGADAA